MKKILIFLTIFIGLICAIALLCRKIHHLNDKLSIAENNTKALMLENSELDSTSRVLKLTIEQLECAKDSISKQMIKTIEDVKKKKNKISQLQYMLTTNFRIDTIAFTDTIFVKNTAIDTCITDNKWYSLDLQLSHPNSIVVSPKFVNEFTTIFSYKKETIYPPKKFFLWRWFQKKHYVTETTVINNNPYSSTDTTRFIEIIER